MVIGWWQVATANESTLVLLFSLFLFAPESFFFFSFPSPIQVGLAGILDKLIKGAWMLVPVLCLGKWVQDAASTDSGDFGVILAPLGYWTAHSSACGFAFQRPCLEAEWTASLIHNGQNANWILQSWRVDAMARNVAAQHHER